MDIRLTMDGGPSPKAPPGKVTESPPKPKEFEKTLQTAKKEETPGEVADKEPNAQLQKLDSEKKEAGTKVPAAPTVAQIHIDPAILAQLQFAGITQIAATVNPLATTPVEPGKQCVVKILDSNTAKVDPTGAKIDMTVISPIAKAVIAQIEPDKINLDATKNPVISDLVTTAFSNVVASTSKALLVLTGNPIVQDPSFKIDLALTSDQKQSLNITSVRSAVQTPVQSQNQSTEQTTITVIERAVATVVAPEVQKPTGQALVKPTMVANATEFSSTATRTVAAPSQTLAGGKDNSQSDDKPNEDSNSASQDVQAHIPVQDAAPISSTASTHQLTTAERQAMVDTISKRIDELAAKSVRNEVRIEMHPPELGSVVINIRKDMAGLTATLNASNEPLRQALHETRNDLAGALAYKNVGQVKIEVRGASADTMNMGQQFNQARSQHDQHQQHQTRQTSLNAGKVAIDSKKSPVPTAPRRAITTLLDMEI